MSEERSNRKVYRGVVVSDKMDKTIVVEIQTSKQHSKYGKRVKFSTKLHAHDEENVAKVGDVVEVMATRPLSATKRFRLVKVVEKATVL